MPAVRAAPSAGARPGAPSRSRHTAEAGTHTSRRYQIRLRPGFVGGRGRRSDGHGTADGFAPASWTSGVGAQLPALGVAAAYGDQGPKPLAFLARTYT